MSGGKSAHSFYPAPGIYHLRMMSHINSYRRASLGNKSPYEMFAFMYGEEILKKLGLKLIPPDEINLSPELLK